MSSIELYAELLLNIRTVTLFASLKSEHTKETKAELSADGETLTLTHEGESASIRLPTQISGGGSATLTLPASPAKELTFRLQLQEKSPGLLKFRDESDNPVPWSATPLENVSRIACRDCGNELVKSGGVSMWKDLPNESWAEMMDFWHCHKPDEHHLHDNEAGKNKGYAASNRLRAVSGTGFVDLSYLLFAEQDCGGVNVRQLPFPWVTRRRPFQTLSLDRGRVSDTTALYQIITDNSKRLSLPSASSWCSMGCLGVLLLSHVLSFTVHPRDMD